MENFQYARNICLALFLASCSGGGNSPPPPNPYPGLLRPTSGWTDYGTGTGAGFIQRFLSTQIVFPSPNVSVNYVYTLPPGPITDRTIRLNYNLEGIGTFGTVDGGAPSVSLFFWQSEDTGGNTYRWWCGAAPLVFGDNQTIACTVSPQVAWTDVNGQSASINTMAFLTAASNPFAVGFTFGGMFFGHGVWMTSGYATMTINSYTVE